jgi:hypothetical protein
LSQAFQFINAGTTASIPVGSIVTGLSFELLANSLAAGTSYDIYFGMEGTTFTSMGLYLDSVQGTEGTQMAGANPPNSSSLYEYYIICLSTGTTGKLMLACAGIASVFTINTTVNNWIEVFNNGSAAGTATEYFMTAVSA